MGELLHLIDFSRQPFYIPSFSNTCQHLLLSPFVVAVLAHDFNLCFFDGWLIMLNILAFAYWLIDCLLWEMYIHILCPLKNLFLIVEV